MRYILLALLISFMTCNLAVAAQIPDNNGEAVLCIFTEASAEFGDIVLDDVVPGQLYSIYFVLYHAEMLSRNMGGFEFSWRVEPAAVTPVVTGIQYGIASGFCYNFGDSYNFLVGYSQRDPHPVGEEFLLMRMSIMFDETPSNAAIYLGPSVPASVDGQMTYADFVLPEDLWPMVPNNPTQSLDAPVFFFNSTVAVEERSLSAIKALF